MKLTASNDFHGTTCEIEAIGVYPSESGPVADVMEDELRRAATALCGMPDCMCSGPHALTDEAGNVYAIAVSAWR